MWQTYMRWLHVTLVLQADHMVCMKDWPQFSFNWLIEFMLCMLRLTFWHLSCYCFHHTHLMTLAKQVNSLGVHHKANVNGQCIMLIAIMLFQMFIQPIGYDDLPDFQTWCIHDYATVGSISYAIVFDMCHVVCKGIPYDNLVCCLAMWYVLPCGMLYQNHRKLQFRIVII